MIELKLLNSCKKTGIKSDYNIHKKLKSNLTQKEKIQFFKVHNTYPIKPCRRAEKPG
jgi:hypothetical protein